MTRHATRRAQEVNGRATVYRTFNGAVREALEAADLAARTLSWPSSKYAEDPEGFARDILGMHIRFDVEGEHGQSHTVDYQAKIIEDLVHHDRVAVTSGHKLGKSTIAVIAALWWFCSFKDARVIMTSTTAKQVNTILWRELRMMLSRHGKCAACALSDPEGRIPKPCPHSAMIPEASRAGELAATGMKADDFREVWGFSSDQAEAVAGISGSKLLYIVDEASGVPDIIFEAIEGNRMGGAKILLLSNPTKNSGYLFDAFHSKSAFWRKHQLSCLQSPNYIAGRKIIPGLATRSDVDERAEEHGAESAWYKIRVLGQFALAEEGRPFDHEVIGLAEQRYDTNLGEGRLCIGLDPAGPSARADDTAFAIRRGDKCLAIRDQLKTTKEGIVVELLRIIDEFSLDSDKELPLVVYDQEGPIGYELQGPLKVAAPGVFQLYGIRASDKARRLPRVYDLMAAELVANLERWTKQGKGAIPALIKLEEELHTWEYFIRLDGRLRVDKKLLMKSIGRSPDRADALALSVWEPKVLALPKTKTVSAETHDGGVSRKLQPSWGRKGGSQGRKGPMSPW